MSEYATSDFYIPGITERCGQTLGIPKQQQNVHNNKCPETFNLWTVAERILYKYQKQFSINVWVGIVDDYLVGLCVLPHQLTGNRYRDILFHDLLKPMEDVALAVRAQCSTWHDDALAHFSHAVQVVLNNTYHDWWIGRGGPTAWLPYSLHLNRGHLKTLVYAASVYYEGALHHHIVDVCQAICNYTSIFEQMRQSMMRRVEMCIESALTKKLSVSGYMLMWTFLRVLVCGTCTQSWSTPFIYTLYMKKNVIWGI
jgi:hypothetical protein